MHEEPKSSPPAAPWPDLPEKQEKLTGLKAELAAVPRADTPWGLGTVLGMILVAAAVILLLGGGIQGAMLVSDRNFAREHPLLWLASSVALEDIAFLIGVPWLILLRFHVGLSAVGWRRISWRLLSIGVLGLLAALVSSAVIQLVLNAVAPGFLQSNVQQTIGDIKHPGPVQAVVLAILIVIVVPLVEETLFRGVIYQGLRHFFGRWLSYHGAVFAGAMTSALIFGIVHFEPHTLPQLVALGLVLAYVFEYTRSIFASALTHGLVNGLALLGFLLNGHG